MIRDRKPKTYVERSARAKARLYIRMKNRLRRAAPVLGGLFHTRDYMPLGIRWMSFGFLGKRSRVVYICSLRTAAYAYKDAVESAAYDEAEALAPREPWPTRLTDANIDEFFSRPTPTYPQLDGLTHLEWARREERRIADSGKISVREYVNIKRDSRWGISVDAVIDVPVLTIEVVNDFIRRFLETEAPSRGAKDLTFTYDQAAGGSLLESNAIIEPWDWHEVEINTEATEDSVEGKVTSLIPASDEG
jgi:hypothetical protein